MSNNAEDVGFIGLGVMGKPMALNLAKAGSRLVVWNRSPDASEVLRGAGASVAASAEEVFSRTRIVICMMANEAALDSVLGRGTPRFARRAAGHIVVSMGSNPPEYSRALGAEITAAGGRYVEAPVSGSRKPAEAGQLVCLVAGEPDTVEEIRPLLAPMCRQTVPCGSIGNAMLMKLSVNLYLNTMLAALAEAMHFAERNGLDLDTFRTAIDAGPMASDVTRVKIPMLATWDFSVQAATADAFHNTCLIREAARAARAATPLLDLASALYGESVTLGNGRKDMVSVVEAIEARTAALDDAMARRTARRRS